MNLRFSPPLRGVIANIGSLFGVGGKDGEKEQLDVDKDGEVLYKEDVIKFVTDELEKRRNERSPLEQQWTLNANFLVGNQYCDINTYKGGIEQIEPVHDFLERETFNQIAPLIETRVANLKKITYQMKVKPRTNELDDYAKADVSTAILQHTQSISNFETQKNTMIAWNELCGNCFWLSWWDANKGEMYASETIAEIGEDGIERKQERAYYEGDLDYGLITPYEIYPESIFKQTVDNQRSIIIEQVKTVEDVLDLYGVKVNGTSVETFELTPLPSGGGYGYESTVMTLGHRTVENAVRVITYLERPSPHRPKGRMILIAGDDTLLYYGPLPYGRIPIVQCICREIPGQFFGKSVIEDLIPRQRAYNGCMNRIHEYIKRITIQGYVAEEGAVDIDDYEENGQTPGVLLEYRKGFAPPTPIPNGVLPGEIMTERYNLVRDMEYVAGVSQLTTSGAAPSGVTSGVALEAIKATDDTRLSLTGDHIRNCVKNLARLWLEIYKQYADTPRAMRYVGANEMAKAMIWSQEDINSYDVEYTTENELVMSEDMQKQRFLEAYNLGLFTDENGRIPERVKHQALECMKIGKYSELLNINQLQLQAAQRENVFFESGVFPEVSEIDDHQIHIEEHMRYMLQMRYQVMQMKKPAYADAMIQHLNQHKQAIADEQAKGMMEMQQLQQIQTGQALPEQKEVN